MNKAASEPLFALWEGMFPRVGALGGDLFNNRSHKIFKIIGCSATMGGCSVFAFDLLILKFNFHVVRYYYPAYNPYFQKEEK